MGKHIVLDILIVLAISAVLIQGSEAKEDLNVYWKDGLRLTGEDFQFKIGGRIMLDFAFFDEDASVGDIEDATEFRRARLYFAGLIYNNVDFKAQYDFAGGDADFKDVYIGYKGVELGHIKVGHFKEAFSLEELTSSKYITFMERSLPIEAFAPSRNTGIGINSTALDDKLTWAVGLFRETDGFGEGEGSDWNVTGRITGLPVQSEEMLLHVGLALSYKNTSEVQYRSRPESHLAPRVVDTDGFTADNVSLVGLESALVCGPFSLQGEYILSSPDMAAGVADPDFSGYYLCASYFLTGEQRKYKASSGTFSRVKPNENVGVGPGAWEVGARYSSLDLTDAGIAGGEIDDITLGVNWYLNPNTRVMLNYVMADADAGDVNVIQTRFQIDF